MERERAEKGTTAQVSARVPLDVAETLAAMATKHDRSLSWVVAYVLKDWMKQKGSAK